MATSQGDIMVGSVKNMVDRLSKDFSATKPPMSIHEPRKSTIFNKPVNQMYVAAFAYKATQGDELNLAVGDIIELLEEIEDGWNRGKNLKNGEIGMYPTNFVEPKSTPTNSVAPVMRGGDVNLEPEATKRAPSVVGIALPTIFGNDTPKSNNFAKPVDTRKPDEGKMKEMARVKFPYEPQHPDELKLGEIGALIEIIRKDTGDPGWFEGELHGKKGLFPDNFVELVQVPVGTVSGSTKGSTMKVESKSTSKAPILPPSGTAAAPPAVPAKPKPKLTDSNPSLNTIPHNAAAASAPASNKPATASNFTDIRNKLANLNMFAPGDPAPSLSKSTIVTGSSADDGFSNRPTSTYEFGSEALDKPAELNHVTKDRPRGPGKRPISMMALKKKGSTENLLESPTNQFTAISLSSLVENTEKTTPAAQEITQPAASPSRFIAMKPLKEEFKHEDNKPYFPHNKEEPVKVRTNTYHPTTGSTKVSPIPPVESDTVSRKEYNDLLARLVTLESRLAALEASR